MKIYTLLILTITLIILLAACGGKVVPSNEEMPSDPARVPLTSAETPDLQSPTATAVKASAGGVPIAQPELSTPTQVLPETVITFADENVEAAIRYSLGKGLGDDITAGEVANITGLSVYSASVDLSGIEHLVNLAHLDFSGIRFIPAKSSRSLKPKAADLSLLAKLTNLTVLDLARSLVSDISPLADLTNLTELDVSRNRISDISPLANLTNLTDLSLRGNQISDISPLANLTNLSFLWLEDNQISDLSPLANLTNLTTLDLRGNQISDLSPLANLTNLTMLDLRGNQISDISPLANMTSLTELVINDNQISDISPLAKLSNLAEIWLWGNQISDISPLVENSGLGTGDHVWLGNNNLDLQEGSEDLKNIRQLEARGVSVTVPPSDGVIPYGAVTFTEQSLGIAIYQALGWRWIHGRTSAVPARELAGLT